MIHKEKATEIVKDILQWLEQDAVKCILKKGDGSIIAETTNLTYEKDANGNFIVRYANGYAIGRIFCDFNLSQSLPTDVIIDIADLVDNSSTPLARSMYIGTIYAGTQNFSVVVEVALPYIIEEAGNVG